MYLEDLPAAARAIRGGLTTSRAVVEAALRRYEETEPRIHAFAWLDRDRALRLADEADAAVRRGDRLGPLHGAPVGVKDIFDTAGIPTENGSRLYAGRVPGSSAQAVRALEAAGAIVFGKTVTAELAYYHPGPTRNPHDTSRTPGGSSMGSAAAVAAGVIPAATGSQTNGSVIRPAAFCGVVGAKPTFGRIPREGVMPFAPSLDTLGGFARTVEGAALLCAAMAREPVERWWPAPSDPSPRFAAVRTKDWEKADDAMRARFQQVVDALGSAGRPIEWPALPVGLDDAVPVLATLQVYEGARHIGPAVLKRPDLVDPVTRGLVERGMAIPDGEHTAALRERDRLIAVFADWAAPFDAVLTLAAMGEAPGPETTGDPTFCSRWTLVGAPAVTVPAGRGPHGLPLGLQLVGAPGDDARLFAAAAWAEKVIAGT